MISTYYFLAKHLTSINYYYYLLSTVLNSGECLPSRLIGETILQIISYHSKVIHFSKLNIDTFTFVISVGILIMSVDPKVTLSLQDPDNEFISDLQWPDQIDTAVSLFCSVENLEHPHGCPPGLYYLYPIFFEV